MIPSRIAAKRSLRASVTCDAISFGGTGFNLTSLRVWVRFNIGGGGGKEPFIAPFIAGRIGGLTGLPLSTSPAATVPLANDDGGGIPVAQGKGGGGGGIGIGGGVGGGGGGRSSVSGGGGGGRDGRRVGVNGTAAVPAPPGAAGGAGGAIFGRGGE